jgi:hypothetical protein
MRRPRTRAGPCGPVIALLGPALAIACGARTGIEGFGSYGSTGAAADSGLPDAITDGPMPEAFVTMPDGGCKTNSACDDGIVCTTDTCDRATGDCLHEPQNALCPDGLYCAGDNNCNPQMGCVNTPRNCDDGIACTRDSCDEGMMSCDHVPDDSLCPVGFACDAMLGCVARGFAETADVLFAVRLPQGTTSAIGPTGAEIDDIALHPNGTLYGVSPTGFYTLDPATGNATFVAGESTSLNALDAAPDGTLYAAGGNALGTLDPTTGAFTMVLSYPAPYTSSGDLAIIEGTLLATVTDGGGGNDELLAIDLASGAVSMVGTTGYPCVWGLAAYGTTLFGFTCDGLVLGMDPMSGASTILSMAPGEMFFGASER